MQNALRTDLYFLQYSISLSLVQIRQLAEQMKFFLYLIFSFNSWFAIVYQK